MRVRTLRHALTLYPALLAPGPARSFQFRALGGGGQQQSDTESEQQQQSETTSACTAGQQEQTTHATVAVDASALGGDREGLAGYTFPTVVPKPASVAERRDAAVESFFSSSPGRAADAAAADLRDAVRTRSSALSPFLSETRRLLHQHPELMYDEAVTSSIVRRVLDDLGVEHSTGWAKNTRRTVHPGGGGHGIVADIGTGEGPCVVLRADMDALPIRERTATGDGRDLPYRSRNDGTMHACGHDGHMTMLLGAASVLRDVEGSIDGTVRLVFQPAEEGGAGAKRMREEGVLDRHPRPSHAYGLHVWPALPSGSIGSRLGPVLAGMDTFEIAVTGVGGHAAMPHLAVDPIVASSAIVMNLQSLVSRGLSPLESGVVSVTSFQDGGGGAFNVIPATVVLRGTVRALNTGTLVELRDRVGLVAAQTAAAHGCNVTVVHSPDAYPPTINDPTLYAFASGVAASVASDGRVRDVEPTMAGEDFAFLAESVPSSIFLLGQGSGEDPPTDYSLHHPRFALDEGVMPRGVELHVNLALRTLKKLSDEA